MDRWRGHIWLVVCVSVYVYVTSQGRIENRTSVRLYLLLIFQVLEEGNRLYPAAFIQKKVPPGGLSFMGYDIPAGTTTMVSVIIIL